MVSYKVFQRNNIAVIKKQQQRNPLLAQEPKRSSSSNKIRKFEKLFSIYITYKIKDPNELLNEYLQLELAELNNYFTKYIEYNKNNAKVYVIIDRLIMAKLIFLSFVLK